MKVRIYKKKIGRDKPVYIMTKQGGRYDQLHEAYWPYKSIDIPRPVVEAIAASDAASLADFYKALYKGLKK